MQAEHLEILDFLRRWQPFTELPEETLNHVATNVEVSYFKAGDRILEFGAPVDAWYFIRSGAVEVYRRNGDLYNRLSEGGYFGEFGLLRHKLTRFPAVALEDTLVYLIPDAIFSELFENNELFADFVEVEDRTRLRHALARREDANELMTSRVESLVTRAPVSMDIGSTIQAGAKLMRDEGVSSLLITDSSADDREDLPSHKARMVGVITDRDIRNRLVAEGLDYATPISKVMSTDIIHVEHNQLVFEAMMAMKKIDIAAIEAARRGD